MYLSDLTFIEDGNPDTLDGLININKRRMVYAIIESVQQYQLVRVPLFFPGSRRAHPLIFLGVPWQEGYSFEKNEPLHTFLFEMPTLSEADLFALSLAREPRDKAGTTGKRSQMRSSVFSSTPNLKSSASSRIDTTGSRSSPLHSSSSSIATTQIPRP